MQKIEYPKDTTVGRRTTIFRKAINELIDKVNEQAKEIEKLKKKYKWDPSLGPQ